MDAAAGGASSATRRCARALLERDIKECEDAQPRWDAVWNQAVAAKALVDPARRDYYQAAVLTMITINRESNRALLLTLRKALKDATPATGEGAGRRPTMRCRRSIDSAVDGAGGVRQVEELVSRRLADGRVPDARTGRRLTPNHLKDPMAKLPAPVSWSGWEAYFHIMEYEDERSVDVH